MKNLQRLAEEAKIQEEERLARQQAQMKQQKIEKERREVEQARLSEERRIADIKAKIEEEKAKLEEDRKKLEEDKRKAEEALRKKQIENAKAEQGSQEKVEERKRVEQEKKNEEKERLEKLRELGKEQARYEAEMKGRPDEEKRQGEQERLEQLKKLAQEQAQFEAEVRSVQSKPPPSPTIIDGPTITNESKVDSVIDVQGFRVDADGVIVEDDADGASTTSNSPPNSPLRDLEKQARERAKSFNTDEVRKAAQQQEEAKRRTLEQQARQRAAQKQQFEYEEKRRRLSEQLSLQEEKARIADERARLQEEQKRRAEREKVEQEEAKQKEQYDAIAGTLAKVDDAFVPSSIALENTKLMLQEITGPSIDAQYAAKEGYTTGRNVQVYCGRTESVPVRVSMPGSFVEFTIDKKSLDFGFEIIAFLDSGEQVVLKQKAPFWQYAGGKRESRYEDRLLIVTSPPKELVLKGRRNRCEATLKIIEEDMRKNRGAIAKKSGEIEFLEEDMEKLQKSILKKTNMVVTIQEEERRWGTVLQKLKTGGRNDDVTTAGVGKATSNGVIDTTATAAPTRVARQAEATKDVPKSRSAQPKKRRTPPKGTTVDIRVKKGIRGSGVRKSKGMPKQKRKQATASASAKGARPRKVKRSKPKGSDNVV
ncbi:MAG: hypothetical protein SGARI_000270 [Bacillariaceae sp.]